MSKISAVDFANNVEANRKKLIQHCVENGKEVSSTASLDTVVGVTNTINETQSEGTYKVEFKNIDGSYFVPVQYVQAGGDATIPSETPSYDSDYLEFVRWETSAGDSLTNVQRDILALPFYRTKYSETFGQRPTYLICYFDSTTLSPTLQIGSTHTNTYILWGDGSAAQQVTTSTISHTYAEAGQYVITIYGDSYGLGGSSSAGVFTSTAYVYALSKLYLGENSVYPSTQSYRFANSSNLTTVVLPETLQPQSYMFQSCISLNNVIILKSLGNYMFQSCQSLTNIVLGANAYVLNSAVFQNCFSLTHITLHEYSHSTIGDSFFSNCYGLKTINIPSNVTTIKDYTFTKTSIENINLSNVITISAQAFQECKNLKEVDISSVTELRDSAFGNTPIKTLNIPSIVTMTSAALSSMYCLTNLILPQDFDIGGLNIMDPPLSDACLVDIANKLKDNTGLTAKRMQFSKRKFFNKLNTIYLDSNGQQVDYGTSGAVSLVEFMTNKNWTIVISN